MEFYEILRKRRKEKQITQEDLSYILSVSRQTIYKWENNISVPNLKNFIKLIDVLEICIVVRKGKVKYKNIS